MASNKEYKWDYNDPDILEPHTDAKLRIIQKYTERYVDTLNTTPRQDVLRLTIVDGFCGGGIYKTPDTGEIAFGSPIIAREAVEKAEKTINLNRIKPFVVDADYFYIDKKSEAINCLNKVLKDKGFDDDKTKVYQSSFDERVDEIIEFIQKKGRAHRSLFILDQYAYKDVSIVTINKILRELKNSEIVCTINVESFSKYMTDKDDQSRNTLSRYNLPDPFKGKTIEQIKSLGKVESNLFIQSAWVQNLVQEASVPFYRPFFIRSGSGYGNYLLLHFSKHYRASDVMTQIHWAEHDNFINFLGPGLDMFNCLVHESKEQFKGHLFDNNNIKESTRVMTEQIPEIIYQNDHGLTLETFFATTCNFTPAHWGMYQEVIFKLFQEKELEIITSSGGTRQVANTIKTTDIIRPPSNYPIRFL
ncbi:three-Cys-motif partner protein TcmP [uncultured Cocleimonas sp.]|uniref:three-Cys-motif partner protein TcmP n=1 Tax=uncultured Cocleimonas sp. TaxID=1051587 RepID=UPI0026149F1F|nr:three-Cys-motif partner protein TcmP [uncultured Cocleimonas sp.]